MGLVATLRGLPDRLAAARSTIVASAAPVSVGDTSAGRTRPRKPTETQLRCWGAYRTVGIVHYALNYRADAVSRIRLFPAVQMDPDEEPIYVGDAVGQTLPNGYTITQRDADEAEASLARVQADTGGQSAIVRELMLNLDAAADCYLYASDRLPDGSPGEWWEVLSISELVDRGQKRYEIVEEPGKTRGRPVADDDLLARIWTPDPQFSRIADPLLAAVLPEVQELDLLRAGNRAIAKSRIVNAGLLYVSKDLKADVPRGARRSSGAQPDPKEDPFMAALQRAAEVGIQNPDAAESVVPIIIRAPGKNDGLISQITLDRPMADTAMKRAGECVISIAQVLPISPEFLFGIGETATNATGRLLTEQEYRGNVDPAVLNVCDALTTVVLRPDLSATDPSDAADPGLAPLDPRFVEYVQVWRDPTKIIARPNLFDSAVKVYEKGELSGDTLRRAGGFSDTDKPDEAEQARIDARQTPKAIPIGGDGGGTDETGTDDDASARGRVLVAAGATGREGRVARLGDRLSRLDATLLAQVVAAADEAVGAGLRTVGTRLRSRAQGNDELRSMLRGVPVGQVPSTLGPIRVAALAGDDEDDLLAGTLDDFLADYEEALRRTQAAAVAAVVAVGAASEGADVFTASQLDELAARQAEDRSAAAAFLAVQLRQALRDALYGEEESDRETVGEAAAGALVSVGIIRASLQIAGGAPSTTPGPSGTIVTDTGAPYGEVATGEVVQAAASSGIGATIDEHEWTWAAAGVPERPFGPHEDLDGARFSSWEADVLVNPEGFPPTAYLFPGDHDGCTCAAVPVFVLDEGPALDPF